MSRKSKLKPKLTQRKVDALWSQRVKERDNFRCQLCGRTSNLNSHHILRKQSRLMRYSLLNGITLCAGCHKWGVHSPDLDVAQMHLSRLVAKIGHERLEKIRLLKGVVRKISLQEAWESLGGKNDRD